MLAQLRARLDFVRRGRTDDGPTARSRERYRRAALSSVSSALSRAVTVVTSLITVPLVLGYLGAERYGMWLTLSSMITFLAMADLGVSRGLINHFAGALGKDDLDEASRLVTSAFFSLAGLGIVLTLVFVAAFPWVPWVRLFQVTGALAQSETKPAIIALFACWLFDWIARIFLRVNDGRQAGYINNIWEIAGRVATLGAIVLAIRRHSGLPTLVAVLAGTPFLANLANAVLMMHSNRWLIPDPRKFVPRLARRILKTGVGFLGLDLSFLVIVNGSYLLISYQLGAAAVAEFGVPARAFAIISMAAALIANPLWPAIAEASARGEIDWVKRAIGRFMALTLGAALVPTLVLTLAGREIIQAWVGDAVAPAPSLLAVLGLWSIVFIMGNTVGVFLNGMGAVRFCAMTQMLEAACIVPAQIVLLPRYGICGAVWALAVGDLLLRTAPRLFYCRMLLRAKSSRTQSRGT